MYENTFEYQTFKNTVKVAETQSLVETQTKNLNKIEPNLIQREALKSLTSLRKNAKDKALIISATGTGKTILSALDVRNYDPKKFLFVVHNEGILNRAIDEFKKVLSQSNDADFGLLTGKNKDINAKYLFATIQTLSNENIYNQFEKDHFDYIVFDEAHRSAAATYQKVFNYFKPNFLLGMTATPRGQTV